MGSIALTLSKRLRFDRYATCSQPEPQPSSKAFQEGGRRGVWCVFGLIGDGCGDGAVILQMHWWFTDWGGAGFGMGLDLLPVQCALVAKGCGLCNVSGDGLCCRFDDCQNSGEGVCAMIVHGDIVVVVVAGNERRGDGWGPVLGSEWWWRTDCHPVVGALPRHSPRIPGGRLHLRRPPGRPAGPAEPPRGLPIRITIVGIGRQFSVYGHRISPC